MYSTLDLVTMYAINRLSLYLLPNKCNRKKKKKCYNKRRRSVSGCGVMVRNPDNLDSEPPTPAFEKLSNRKRSAAVY